MKLISVALISLLSLGSVVAADDQWTAANLTACGLGCLSITVPQAGCSLTDVACQCNSTALPALTTACLLANCTSHDTWIVSKVSASSCSLPHPDRGSDLTICAAILVSITSLIVFLRLASKCFVSGQLHVEDYLILVALLSCWPMAYFTLTMAKEGFGKHVYDLNDGDLAAIFKNFYISENLYSFDLSLSKLSILALYVRIFPYARVRYSALATIAFIIVCTIALSVSTIVECLPIPFFWDKDFHGKCLDLNALAYAGGSLSIVQDLLIVVIPIPMLRKQNMGMKKKLSVALLFALGGGGCIASMIRLRTLILYGNSIDPTWDYVDIIIWTSIEQAIAMICACLPAIRRLFIHIWPKGILSSTKLSDGEKNPSGLPSADGRISRKQSEQPINVNPPFGDDIVPVPSLPDDLERKMSMNVHVVDEDDEEWRTAPAVSHLSSIV